jgi:putative Mg2+ transporter-C (MgtC) family protein
MSPAAETLSRFALDDQLLIAGRSGLGALCGLVIGLERQLSNKVVGLRTHMLVAAAAALATGMGELLFTATDDAGDPSRILHAVVTGVGFLGAGTIFRSETRARGLTTAATLFLAAVLGAIAGLGAPVLAIVATVLATVSLRGLLVAEERLKLRYQHEEDL